MASFLKGITTAVIIGSVVTLGIALQYKYETVPPVSFNLNEIKVTEGALVNIVDIFNSPLKATDQKSIIPVERAKSTFLFIVGQDDHTCRNEFFANKASKCLQDHGKEKPQIVCYPGTGHYIDPPYFPMSWATLYPYVSSPVVCGGEPRAHAMAQLDAWKQLQTFFHKHLSGKEGTIPAKL